MTKEKTSTGFRRLQALPQARFSFALIGLSMLIEAAFRAQLPFSVGLLVDGSLRAKDRDALALTLAALLGGFMAAFAAGMLRDWLFSKIQSRGLTGIRQSMFERLQQLSLTFHESTAVHDVQEAFSTQVGIVENAYSMAPAWGMLPAIEAFVCTVTILFLDWHVGLLSLLLWGWTVLAPNTFVQRLADASEKCKDEETRILVVVQENLAAHMAIRSFSLEHLGVTLFRKRNELLSQGIRRKSFLAAAMDRFTETGILFIQIMILGLSTLLVFDDRMSIGKLVSIPILTWMTAQSLLKFHEYLPKLRDAKEALRRIRLLLRDPAPVLDKPTAKPMGPLQSDILLSNVSVPEGGDATLLEFSAKVKRGTWVAFIGPEGSGKTAIAPLLMRFSDPSTGTISIDGTDLKALAQNSVRARIGSVTRDTFVFNASLLENIRLANPTATEEKLQDLIRDTGIDAAASTLPQGLETLLGEKGASISPELTQRLAIARALLRNPDLLLLDEVTAELDPAAEKAVNLTLRRLAKNRTTVAVTSRVACAALADAIYVVDNGRIAEHGTHAELIAADGIYTAMWHRQCGFRFSADGSHVDVEADRLKQLPIFDKLSTAILAELAPLFTSGTWTSGQEIVSCHQPGDRLFIIARGAVEQWEIDESTGEDICTVLLQEGDSFAENMLIAPFRHTATMLAAGVCTCVSLERENFRRVIDRYPELRDELSRIAAEATGAA